MTRTPFAGLALSLAITFSSSIFAKPVVFNIGNGSEPKTIDPQRMEGTPEHHIVQNLFEPLVTLHHQTGKPVPAGAESWEVSKDRKVYTFKLRKNHKWSNGEPITAKDYIYGWTRLLEPKTTAEFAYYGYYFKNGQKFNKGEIKDISQVGFKAIDDYTLLVTLENATPYFLALLHHCSLYPVHRATLEKHGDRWIRPENIVSSGPFVLEKWEVNKVLTVKKNPHYWDKDTVKLDVVNFYPVDKTETEEKMFRTGLLHLTGSVPQEKLPYWQADKTGVLQTDPQLATYYFDLNPNRPPLTDKRVRKALNLAIDREKMVKYVAKGGQPPATTFTPPKTGPDGYVPTPRLPKDLSRLEEAKKLLAEAGYPGGKGFPTMDLVYNTMESHKKIAEAIQEMWRQNLGINITLSNQEWKVFIDTRKQHNFHIARDAWVADYNDPNAMLDIFMTGVLTNNPGWSNKAYDAELKAAAAETDVKKRLAHFSKAEDILLEELPVVPLYHYMHSYLLKKSVKGWSHNNQDDYFLKYVRIEE